MKKIIVFIFCIPFFANAQKLIGGKNIIKTNLAGDLVTNYNITYERALLKKMSFSVGFRYMPKSGLPSAVKNGLEKLIDDPDVKIASFQMGNFAITPELRLYLSAGKMKGFYIAPYARYASFDLTVPVTYTNPAFTTKPEVLFNGTFKSFSGGLLLGTQFQIAKKLVLDFWIIGAHYGSSTGTINAYTNEDLGPNSSAPAWSNLQAQLDDFKEVGPFKFEGKVTSSHTADITTTGAWAGIRALGLSLGVRL